MVTHRGSRDEPSTNFSRNDTTVVDASISNAAMRDGSRRRIEVECRLRHAIDGPALSVMFRPVVEDLGTRIRGFTALPRWSDPETDITAAEFVSVAEESGLIVPIGAFVLDEACRHAAYWRSRIPGTDDLYVAVGLSPRQLLAADVVDMVAEALERHTLPPSALHLAMTPTATPRNATPKNATPKNATPKNARPEATRHEAAAITAAARCGLRMLGVELPLDDFAAGGGARGHRFLDAPAIAADEVPAVLHAATSRHRTRRHLAVRAR